MVCTFFGHRDAPEEIRRELSSTIQKIVERDANCVFYVGNQGNFDRLVLTVLKELVENYPSIRYYIVLSYLNDTRCTSEVPSVFPEGLESVPPRFAIDKRNRWMVEQADCVIAYVCHRFGGAAKYCDLASRKGKTVINLSDRSIAGISSG